MFVAGQMKSKEGISNLNPDFADRWRHLPSFTPRRAGCGGRSAVQDRTTEYHRAVNSRGKCS
jgi:hypothetical protein